MADTNQPLLQNSNTKRTRSAVSLSSRKRVGSKQHIVGHSTRLRSGSSRNLSKLNSNTNLSLQTAIPTTSAEQSTCSNVPNSSRTRRASSSSLPPSHAPIKPQVSRKRSLPPRRAILSIGIEDNSNDDDGDEDEEDRLENINHRLGNGKIDTVRVHNPGSSEIENGPDPVDQPALYPSLRNSVQIVAPENKNDMNSSPRCTEVSTQYLVNVDDSDDAERQGPTLHFTSESNVSEPKKLDVFETSQQHTSLRPSTLLYDALPPPQISSETIVAIVGTGVGIAKSLASDPEIRRRASASGSISENYDIAPSQSVDSGGWKSSVPLPNALNSMKALPLGNSSAGTANITSYFLDDGRWTSHQGKNDNNISSKELGALKQPAFSSDQSVINGIRSLQISSYGPEVCALQKTGNVYDSRLSGNLSNSLSESLDKSTIERLQEQEKSRLELHNVRKYVSPLYDSIRRVRMRMGNKVPPDWSTIANNERLRNAAEAAKQKSNTRDRNTKSYYFGRSNHAKNNSVDVRVFKHHSNDHGTVNSNGSIYNTIAGQRTPKQKSSTTSINDLNNNLSKGPPVMSATTLADLLGGNTFSGSNHDNNNSNASTSSINPKNYSPSNDVETVNLQKEGKNVDIGVANELEIEPFRGSKLSKSVSLGAISGGFRPTTAEGIQKVSTATWISQEKEIPQLIGTIVRNTTFLQALLNRLWTQSFRDPDEVESDTKEVNQSSRQTMDDKSIILSSNVQGEHTTQGQQISPSILAQAQQAQHKMMLAQQVARNQARIQHQQQQRQQQVVAGQNENLPQHLAQLQRQDQLAVAKERENTRQRLLQNQEATEGNYNASQPLLNHKKQRDLEHIQDPVAQAQARRAQHYQLQQQQIQQAQQQMQKKQMRQQQTSQQANQIQQTLQLQNQQRYEKMRPTQPGATVELNKPL